MLILHLTTPFFPTTVEVKRSKALAAARRERGMYYGILADGVMIVHFGFVLFVVLGGLLVSRWRWLVWVNLPAALWGVCIEWMGGTSPFTPLENRLRTLSGKTGYTGDCLGHYLLTMLYPAGLTRYGQITLGVMVLLINGLIYSRLWTRER